MVLDLDGKVVEGKKPEDLPKKSATGEEKRPKYLPLYQQLDENKKVVGYVYPVSGKGLWSTLRGYLAVKPNGSEIVGLAFYSHAETPGLGAEIEKTWFTTNFIGKTLMKNGQLVGVNVVKGKAANQTTYATQKDHMVDGISGATITGNGVAKMMRVIPRRYLKFFQNRQRPKAAMDPLSDQRMADLTGGQP